MTPIHVSMLPAFAEQADLHGQVAVMIDILRASTTIVHALANGAEHVIPCSTVAQAKKLSLNIPRQNCLLGGERNCQTIEGFDLDNSPLNYTQLVVKGKQIIFTTTNGTYALERCRDAQRILIGAFVNIDAVVQTLQNLHLPIHLVCAGTNRNLTAEDILFAGAVIDQLLKKPGYTIAGVQSQMAVDFFRSRNTSAASFRTAFFESLGAENLIRLGMQPDIERAMEFNRFDVVPEWNPQENLIRIYRNGK